MSPREPNSKESQVEMLRTSPRGSDLSQTGRHRQVCPSRNCAHHLHPLLVTSTSLPPRSPSHHFLPMHSPNSFCPIRFAQPFLLYILINFFNIFKFFLIYLIFFIEFRFESSRLNLVVKVRVWLKRAQTQTGLDRGQSIYECVGYYWRGVLLPLFYSRSYGDLLL